MIYLFTGNMGTGKTSRVVSMILNNEDGLFKMKLEDGTEVDRPLYFCHIDGLDKRQFKFFIGMHAFKKLTFVFPG